MNYLKRTSQPQVLLTHCNKVIVTFLPNSNISNRKSQIEIVLVRLQVTESE